MKGIRPLLGIQKELDKKMKKEDNANDFILISLLCLFPFMAVAAVSGYKWLLQVFGF